MLFVGLPLPMHAGPDVDAGPRRGRRASGAAGAGGEATTRGASGDFVEWQWRGPGLLFSAPASWTVSENHGTAFTARSRVGVLRFALVTGPLQPDARAVARLALADYETLEDRRTLGERVLPTRHGFSRHTIWGTGRYSSHAVRFAVLGYHGHGHQVYLRAFWYEVEGDGPQQLIERTADSLRPEEP